MSEKVLNIFVVEDNEWYNRLLVHTLSLNPDYVVHGFQSGKECLDNLHKNPDIITLDYRLPDMNGIEVLKKIKSANENIQVVLVSEQSDIEVVVDLLKQGAYDYIVKSSDLKERLLNTIHNIRQKTGLEEQIHSLRREIKKKYRFQDTIIGESDAIKQVYDLIEKAFRTNITVSISGETGTGKELVAKAIHYNSVRSEHSFVPVNVAAIPSELIESEIFGHEKGAFTGANYRRIGKFEEAHGGTLFLDEIAEMDMTFQAKLLRALQEREIYRVGSNKPIRIDTRIIVATNKNLRELVHSGHFRQDLYFRLFGLPIELPPLRERGKDVLIMAKHFIDHFCRENNLSAKSLSPEARNILLSYAFPGNVRELKSVMELAVTLSTSDKIEAEDIIPGSDDPLPGVLNEELTLREYDRKIVNAYLKRYDNNTKIVAEKLDIGVSTIYRMMKDAE